MKKITLYQATNGESFARNMFASTMDDYSSIDEMEAVVMLREPDADDMDILNELFYKFNSEEYKYSLAYSMSVGDIVTIDDKAYRCMPIGWKQL